jgi:hypothetical protein
MDPETIAMIVIGSVSAISAFLLIQHVLSSPRYIYTSPKITIRPEGGGGSCSSFGDCEWGQGANGPQVETVNEVDGDGTYYPLVKTDRPYSENWSYKGVEIELPIHIPSHKEA